LRAARRAGDPPKGHAPGGHGLGLRAPCVEPKGSQAVRTTREDVRGPGPLDDLSIEPGLVLRRDASARGAGELGVPTSRAMTATSGPSRSIALGHQGSPAAAMVTSDRPRLVPNSRRPIGTPAPGFASAREAPIPDILVAWNGHDEQRPAEFVDLGLVSRAFEREAVGRSVQERRVSVPPLPVAPPGSLGYSCVRRPWRECPDPRVIPREPCRKSAWTVPCKQVVERVSGRLS
jgi:hypothetical protein